MASLRRSFALGATLLLALSCSSGGEPEEENLIAPMGKEDNYFSDSAQEYLASADVTFTLDESYAEKSAEEREERARQIMAGRTKQIGWFLHVYLIDKAPDDPQGDYGGLRAMVLDGSYETDGLKADPENPLSYTYVFKVQLASSSRLLQRIRDDLDLPADAGRFPLKMPKLANETVIDFSHSGYSAGQWSPESCNCELETLEIKLEEIARSSDAYLDYTGMLADGVMDISIHFGWDYHSREDIGESRAIYKWLLDIGFESPAKSYEQYNRLSGALTRKVEVNGREILVKVTLFRPDPCVSFDEDDYDGWAAEVEKDEDYKKRACPDWGWKDKEAVANPTTDAGAGRLKQDLLASMKTRDVIIFSGHSGYTYAYALASWYRTSAGDLDPPEIRTLDLPPDRSQIFVMSGCDTYHVGQAFKDNPAKRGLRNADVITSTTFAYSARDSIEALIEALGGDRWDGKVEAATYAELLRSFSSYTLYGVHGIDDNPLANPFGDPGKSCQACEKDADCGAAGNVCVRLNDDEKVCAVECVADAGCAEGQVCRKFGGASSGYLKGKVCVPKQLTCKPKPQVQQKKLEASGTVGRGEEKHYEVPVGLEARQIKVVLTGAAAGDADLYTRFEGEPTREEYDCRPFAADSNETCEHKKAAAGVLHVMVRGWLESSDFQLKITWE